MAMHPDPTVDEILAHPGWLRALARGLVRDANEADDLAQEACVAALEHPPAEDRPLRPWFARVLRHAWLRRRRGEQRRARRELAAARSEELSDAAGVAELVELQRDVAQAVLELEEPCRSAIYFHYFEGRSALQIADRLGIPAATVRQRLKRGRERLRQRLDARYSGRGAWLGSALTLAGRARPSAPLATGGSASRLAPALRDAVVLLASNKALVGMSALVLLAAGLSWMLRAAPLPRPPAGAVAGADVAPPVLDDPERAGERVPGAPGAPNTSATSGRTRGPLAAPSSASGQGTVVVRAVRERSGWPVAGELVLLLREQTGSLPLEIAATTDASGTARIEGVPAGAVEVGLLHGGLPRPTVDVPADGVVEVELAVLAGMSLRGTVLDADGGSVPGAEILVSERTPHNDRTHSVARADAGGRFQLDGIQEDHEVVARSPGYAPSIPVWVHGRAGDEVPITLVLGRPGAELRGRVIAPGGEAVPGASVLVGAAPRARMFLVRSERDRVCADQVVVTDPDGAFAIETAPLGVQPLLVRARGFAQAHTTVEVVPAGPNEVVVTLSPQARLSGRVLDADGRPVPGADVRARAERTFETCATRCDADGRFSLAGFPLGEVRFVASHPDLGRAETQCVAGAGAALVWNPALAPGPAIRGVVVERGGRPAAGWQVEIAHDEEWAARITDGDGRFAFEGLCEGLYSLAVQHSPGASNQFPALVLEDVVPSAEQLRLVVEGVPVERGALAGRVVGPDGVPPASAVIEVGDANGTWRVFTPDPSTGLFVVEGVVPGECWVGFAAAEAPRATFPSVTVVAGETTDLGEVRLARPTFARVRVTGVPAELRHVLEISVVRPDSDEEDPQSFELVDEAFESPPLESGPYELRLDGPGVESRRLAIDLEPERPLDVTVATRRAGVRRVVLTQSATGEPPGWMWCEVVDAQGAWLWTGGGSPRLEQGAWTVELELSARPGVQRYVAGTSQRRSSSGEVEIPAVGLALEPLVVRFQEP